MPSLQFHVVETNPNEVCGGGGCLCSETAHADQEGPYVVFTHVDTDSTISPRSVLCAPCARAAVAALDGEVLAGGETGRPRGQEVPVAETTSDPQAGDTDDVPEV